MLDALRARLRKLFSAGPTALERSAAQVQAKLRSDATTRRGNVPQFAPGPKGRPGETIPITAKVETARAIVVSAPTWVMDKARERGQTDEWGEIVRAELDRAFKG